ncbi:M24 family metallopeptidase [Muribaculum intestinale]|uniref:M24 family metallopeptidase n=1 Tax=Muribaculum intestinale TaxID=1796646 RepID=UPI0025A9B5C9|nr:Xaa-Pro peptidase family protein [Muribaculum intestinale]
MELYALTPVEEISRRISKIQSMIVAHGIDAILITDNTNIYYTLGRVISGWVYISAKGNPIYFVRRPEGLKGDNVCYIHKPELIPAELSSRGYTLPGTLGLELAVTSYLTIERLKAVFPECAIADASKIMRKARAVKTHLELKMLRQSGIKHARVYSRIPHIFRPGMTDIELQIEIERISRLEGCLGQFRISGDSMELFMANVLAGDNADNPTPYDFAMGGAGLDPSLPVGADGSIIKPGMSVMVDANGNFTGYMTDMTRVFSYGNISEEATRAHRCSIDICRELEKMGRPGTKASDMYEKAIETVKAAGLERHFMGYTQKAGFIGHGVGIEINELPVIAPRSRDILQENNVLALEPKFVVPGVGAVGIENTYIVTSGGLERITDSPEDIISLE